MTNDEKLMQQALDALENTWTSPENQPEQFEFEIQVMELLEARLAQPDDEPQWIYKVEVPAGTESHHWAVVMHDLDKTVEGWSEDVKLYYDGELVAPKPEPEPVAWLGISETWGLPKMVVSEYKKDGYKPVYLAPPQREWQGLTDEEYKAIRYGHDENGEPNVEYELFDEGEYGMEVNIYVDDFYRAIEAKLKEKNNA